MNISFKKYTGSFQKIVRRVLSVGCYTGILLASFFLISMKPVHAQIGNASVIQYDWRVVRVFPHDTNAFTQGLIFRDGYLYESTGRRGKSEVRKVRLETGEVIQRRQLEPEYFGEGLAAWNDRLIQLTLNSGIAFVYDMKDFERSRSFSVDGEGWGLTASSDHLIMSDGSAFLRFLDPATFEETHRLQVTEYGEPVSKLNELEMIEGKIFANVLSRNAIIVIDPKTGVVTGRIDLHGLVTMVQRKHSVNILNGIAHDEATGRILVTGKLWPNLFEIEIRE